MNQTTAPNSGRYGSPAPGRHRPVRPVAVDLRPIIGGAIVGIAAAAAMFYAFDRDTEALPVTPSVVVTPPPPALEGEAPYYPQERWQDPSGLPYCYADGTPQDLLPCIDAQTRIIISGSPVGPV